MSDEKQCPMCPVEFRNISATAGNLLNRLNSNSTLCDVNKKFNSLCDAVTDIQFDESTDQRIKDLISICDRVVQCKTLKDLIDIKDELQEAYNPVSILVDKHFEDGNHKG